MYVLFVNRANRNLIRLMNSWNNPGSRHRKLPQGTIIEKLGSNALLMSDDTFSVRLLQWLKGRDRDDVSIFKVEELTESELGDELLSRGIISLGIIRPPTPS